MNEWGIPDWRNADAYGETAKWEFNRWRWEFLRRRDDLRKEFDQMAESHFSKLSALYESDPASVPSGLIRPNAAGFFILTNSISYPGFERLPNPRIGDQPKSVIAWTDIKPVWMAFKAETPPDGYVRFDLRIDRPIGPQLKMVKKTMKEMQGRRGDRKRHPEKWLNYLRVLDAKEAGAPWSQIAKILPMTAGTAQTASNVWDQARALCFNF